MRTGYSSLPITSDPKPSRRSAERTLRPMDADLSARADAVFARIVNLKDSL